ncbi:hypothetical protein PENSPDRAFT_655465 [Peniophora sp. CONT]|nr:hypothetical protein PENSPDRAFT_655465 [Peniophora sp. CONT]
MTLARARSTENLSPRLRGVEDVRLGGALAFGRVHHLACETRVCLMDYPLFEVYWMVGVVACLGRKSEVHVSLQ